MDKKIRKTTENPIVKMAPIGFSQNDSCSKRTWRATSGRSPTPRNDPLSGASVVLTTAPLGARRRAAGAGVGVGVGVGAAAVAVPPAASPVSPR